MTHAAGTGTHSSSDVRNSDVSWSEFDSIAYWKHNYRTLHENDGQIIRAVGKFFVECFDGSAAPAVAHSVDVGSGANLYPALTALPWSRHITLTDYAEPNIAWLRHNVSDQNGPWAWQPFWDELGDLPAYASVASPRKALAERHKVEQTSVFDLPQRRWGLGTMFFVAESITSDYAEFELAMLRFLEALTPRAPFACAFMSGSEGYDVGPSWFPAVDITDQDVRDLLSTKAVNLDVQQFKTEKPLREGYESMILALGRVDLG
ncbi:MAG TPA: SCO2525 family SAM-dependent methyltransferase [Mycobacteriales bacterium]|nr:SCO2525 family SAM-dependent methyltransferase [Mycobacteriales bacterium]